MPERYIGESPFDQPDLSVERPAATGYHAPPDPCKRPTVPPPKPSDALRSVRPVHRTEIVLDDAIYPPLFSVRCSCGWEPAYLVSDPRAAEQEGARHESEAHK